MDARASVHATLPSGMMDVDIIKGLLGAMVGLVGKRDMQRQKEEGERERDIYI